MSACRFCGNDTVISGRCVICRQYQSARPLRTEGRRHKAKCTHRTWREGAASYVGGERRRRDVCAGCGITREVEV